MCVKSVVIKTSVIQMLNIVYGINCVDYMDWLALFHNSMGERQ